MQQCSSRLHKQWQYSELDISQLTLIMKMDPENGDANFGI